MHWAAKYIGLKHAPGGRGPKEVDCWGLLRLIYLNEFNIELPILPGISVESIQRIHGTFQNAIREEWKEVKEPFDGAAVAMSQSLAIHHVGVWAKHASANLIIHCWDRQHTICDTMKGLHLKGFLTIKFYRHRLWHS